MKALVLDRPNAPLRLADVPTPEPGPGEVLVKVNACGVGLTVVNICQGRLGGPSGELRNRIPDLLPAAVTRRSPDVGKTGTPDFGAGLDRHPDFA